MNTPETQSGGSLKPVGSVRCWNCEEWEPIINTGCGWCPVFDKETKATHGKQCTAFIPLPPNTELTDRRGAGLLARRVRARVRYLPPIAWVARAKHIEALRRAVDEGIDYCPECADLAADEYRAKYPQWKDLIFSDGGNDPMRESDSPSMCYRCNEMLACSVIDGPCIWTEAQWLRAP